MFEVNNNFFTSIVTPGAFSGVIEYSIREALIAIVINNTANTRVLTQNEFESLMKISKGFCEAEKVYFKTKGTTNTTKYNFVDKNTADELVQLFITLTKTNVWYERVIDETNKVGFSWHDYRTGREYSLYYITEEEK